MIVLKKERKKFVLLEVLAGVSITNYCIIQLHHVGEERGGGGKEGEEGKRGEEFGCFRINFI